MNHNHGNNFNSYLVMFIIMIISGLLSTMNIWADKASDIRFSINDLYMVLLMSGWMFLFMGLYYRQLNIGAIGLCIVFIIIWCIRTQFMVTKQQYLLGMIPHHSMAILMSKQLLKKEEEKEKEEKEENTDFEIFLEKIIDTQENEIMYMKNANNFK